jgi:hypothetical protein
MIHKSPLMLCLISLFAFAAAGNGGEGEWKTFTTPAFQDHVLSFSCPNDWEKEHSGYMTNYKRETYGLYFTVTSSEKKALVSMTLIDLKDKMELENLKEIILSKRNSLLQDTWYVDKKYNDVTVVYEDGYVPLGRLKAYYRTFSAPTYYDSQKKAKVKCSSPMKKVLYTVVAGHVALRVSYEASRYQPDSPETYKAFYPMADKIIQSLKVKPVSSLGADVVVWKPYTSRRITLSRRRDYRAQCDFEINMPSNWVAKEISFQPAKGPKEEGNMAVNFLAPEDRASDSYRERVTVICEGLPIGPLAFNDYMGTAEKHVAAIMPKHEKVKTEILSFPEPNASVGSFANLPLRRAESTKGKTLINVYSGKDEKGRDLKIKTYTAGGLTIALNLVYAAESKDFDKFIPLVQEMMESLKISAFSPSVKLK